MCHSSHSKQSQSWAKSQTLGQMFFVMIRKTFKHNKCVVSRPTTIVLVIKTVLESITFLIGL